MKLKTALWLTVPLVIVLAAAGLFAGLLVTPPAHDVHTPGGLPLEVTFLRGDSAAPLSSMVMASQSLDEIRCGLWLSRTHGGRCDPASLRPMYFPRAVQAPDTLYVLWLGCRSDGFNVEYEASLRTVVFHCYSATPYIDMRRPESGAALAPALELVAIPTAGFRSGTVTVNEDDRTERWLGDDAGAYQLAMGTIS